MSITPGGTNCPFDDESFDLAWNWAALWHLPDGSPEGAEVPESFLRELVRVSRKVVFVAMPNRVQVGYLMRKYLLERDFVNYVDERGPISAAFAARWRMPGCASCARVCWMCPPGLIR